MTSACESRTIVGESPLHSASEAEEVRVLMEGCRFGDRLCQERLYKKFYGYAMAVALAYSREREDAIEVVNDSFMKVFDKADSFVTSDPFKPWLRRIVINTAIDQGRRMKRFQATSLDQVAEPEATRPPIESNLHAREILALLSELPDTHRFVFNMYEMEGYSHREIARKLSIAESSSRTYLLRARERLKELYRKREQEVNDV